MFIKTVYYTRLCSKPILLTMLGLVLLKFLFENTLSYCLVCVGIISLLICYIVGIHIPYALLQIKRNQTRLIDAVLASCTSDSERETKLNMIQFNSFENLAAMGFFESISKSEVNNPLFYTMNTPFFNLSYPLQSWSSDGIQLTSDNSIYNTSLASPLVGSNLTQPDTGVTVPLHTFEVTSTSTTSMTDL